jgi:hypothetical protein
MRVKLGISGGRRNAGRRWRDIFRRRRQIDNPMLVLNMSIFNFGGGWDRIINPLNAQQSRY